MSTQSAQSKRRIGIIVFLSCVLLLFVILHLDRINNWLGGVLFILRPVIIGLVLAYLLNPIFRLFERKLLASIRSHGFRRFLSLLLTYIVLFFIFFLLIMLIVPQLLDSVQDFLDNYKEYIDSAVGSINGMIDALNEMISWNIPRLNAAEIQKSIGNFFEQLEIQSFLDSQLTYSNLTFLLAAIGDVLLLVADIFFGLFISLYILHSKERIYAQTTRWRRALFSATFNERLSNVVSIADQSFGGFLRGKILDSSIVGVLVFILISILQIPYPLLIAVIIAITDIVPIIGPFVGVIPSAIIILLTDPIKVIPFLICILVVQQIDGNIIAPKILGENTGVSSLCVMIAITVLGAVWGFVGMIVAVPLFATILALSGNLINKKLRDKGLPVDTHHYYGTKEVTKATAAGVDAPRAKRKTKKARPSLHVGGHGDLTADETARLRAYALAYKHGVMTECTEDTFEAFAAEYAPESTEEAAAQTAEA